MLGSRVCSLLSRMLDLGVVASESCRARTAHSIPPCAWAQYCSTSAIAFPCTASLTEPVKHLNVASLEAICYCAADNDEYTHPQDVGPQAPTVSLQIFISGAPASAIARANPDRSFLVLDAPGGGINVYQSQYGNLHTIDGDRGQVLAHL